MPNEEEDTFKRSEVEEKIQKFLKKNYPQALDEFEVVMKPINSADVNDANIQNLVNAIYYVYLQSPPDACSRLYILIRQFAKAFHEDTSLAKLDRLWKGEGNENLVIPTIETIVIRDMSNPFFIVGKRYNQGKGQTFTLGELNLRIQYVKRRLFDIFNEMYLRNNVQEVFKMPNFEPGKQEVMPEL